MQKNHLFYLILINKDLKLQYTIKIVTGLIKSIEVVVLINSFKTKNQMINLKILKTNLWNKNIKIILISTEPMIIQKLCKNNFNKNNNHIVNK